MNTIQFTTTFSFTRNFTTADVQAVIETANCAVVSMGEPKRGDGDKEVTVTVTSNNTDFRATIKSISNACLSVSDIDNDIYIACYADADFDTFTEVEVEVEVEAPAKTLKYNRSAIMKAAHAVVKRNGLTLANALRMVWAMATGAMATGRVCRWTIEI